MDIKIGYATKSKTRARRKNRGERVRARRQLTSMRLLRGWLRTQGVSSSTTTRISRTSGEILPRTQSRVRPAGWADRLATVERAILSLGILLQSQLLTQAICPQELLAPGIWQVLNRYRKKSQKHRPKLIVINYSPICNRINLNQLQAKHRSLQLYWTATNLNRKYR